MSVTDQTLCLDVSHVFAVSPQRLFDAWLHESWGEWLAPGAMICTSSIVNPKVGGRYSVVMRMPDGREVTISGTYRQITPPHRIVMTWQGDYNREETLITLTFTPEGHGTRLTLRQEGFGTAEFRDRHLSGWNSSLDKLTAWVATP
ncbi:MAG: hypothetical protein BGN85_00845 [Alphaproteobacteria bacterium 64-11]|nr:SRPBCC domain-containing protein [Alphaproteobacteria bacterium]OJU07491.1 MAG: hypothetical protein BGN85_00845 [Alphaproteobacteria bacterium 64-11]